MVDRESLSRRKFLALSGATGAAVFGGCQAPRAENEQLSVEITLSEGLAEQSRSRRGMASYPADRMAEFAEVSLRTLLPEEAAGDLEIVYNSREPAIGGSTAEEAYYRWVDESGSEHASKLLITDDRFHGPVGLADIADDPFESNCAVVGEGYDLLQLEEGDWQEEVLVSEYTWEELCHEINYKPLKTAISGVHEIGHTLGLEHGDGQIYEVEDGVAFSAMAASYLDRHSDSVDIRLSDSVYWSPRFSDLSGEKVRKRL